MTRFDGLVFQTETDWIFLKEVHMFWNGNKTSVPVIERGNKSRVLVLVREIKSLVIQFLRTKLVPMIYYRVKSRVQFYFLSNHSAMCDFPQENLS